jgi:hypothetical protein
MFKNAVFLEKAKSGFQRMRIFFLIYYENIVIFQFLNIPLFRLIFNYLQSIQEVKKQQLFFYF